MSITVFADLNLFTIVTMTWNEDAQGTVDGLGRGTHFVELGSTDEAILLTGITGAVAELTALAIHEFGERSLRPAFFVKFELDHFVLHHAVTNVKTSVLLKQGWENHERGLITWVAGSTVLFGDMDKLSPENLNYVHNLFTRVLKCKTIYWLSGVRKGKVSPDFAPLRLKEVRFRSITKSKQDLSFYIYYFLAKANLDWSRRIKGVSADALRKLYEFPWPGDLPQLKEVIFHAVLRAEDDHPLFTYQLPEFIMSYQNTAQAYMQAVKLAEKEIIDQALREANHHKGKAAKLLNISRKTLYYKLRSFDKWGAQKDPK